MSIFDHQRLRFSSLGLNVEALRRGFYSDRYFENVVRVLEGLRREHYRFAGHRPRPVPMPSSGIEVGDLEVEAQYFNRRTPYTLVAGVDAALGIVRAAAGYFENERFFETWRHLNVEAVEDGVLTHYSGDPMNIQPVIRIRGRYRDFALLETSMLGVMTRASRVATNVLEVLQAAGGKPVLFFPARFDLPEVQAIDGYAYWLAIQRYHLETGHQVTPLASTDAQGSWWGGRGGGTVPHALIACFLADTAEAMTAYARHVPVNVPRIALVDFNNDTVGDSLAVLDAYWPHYRAALQASDADELRRWTLHGVRLDTSANVRDAALGPSDPFGVNPRQIRLVRDALNNAWSRWNVPERWQEEARRFCSQVQIVVSGGFDRKRIEQYEREHVPVDVYGVGSRFFQNDAETNTDYSMDVVRVRAGERWVDMAKVGRQPCDNTDLKPVNWDDFE